MNIVRRAGQQRGEPAAGGDGYAIPQTQRTEKTGTIFVLVSAMLWGMYPLLVHYGVQAAAPLTLAAFSVLSGAVLTFVYALLKGKLGDLKVKSVWPDLLMITLCIVVIPYSLFFVGARYTSGVNTTMLQLSEVIFLLLMAPWFGEPNTRNKLIGTGAIFIGALFLLYNGTVNVNIGDMLIIFSTATYPIGNYYAKRAMTAVSPIVILVVRFFLGGLFLLGLALLIEPEYGAGDSAANWLLAFAIRYWPVILAIGFVAFTVEKIFWYEGLRRLDISKAVSLVMTFPLFSVLYIVLFTGEHISGYQWVGIAVMTLGIWFTVRRPSVNITTTRYGKHLV